MSSYVQEIESSEEEEIDLTESNQGSSKKSDPIQSQSSSSSSSAPRARFTQIRSFDSADSQTSGKEQQEGGDEEPEQYLSCSEARRKFEQMGVSDSVRNALSMVKGATGRRSSASSSSVGNSNNASNNNNNNGPSQVTKSQSSDSSSRDKDIVTETERYGFKSKNNEMISSSGGGVGEKSMQAIKSSSQRCENQITRTDDLVHASSSASKGVVSSLLTSDMAAEKSSFRAKKQETLASKDMIASKEAIQRLDRSLLKTSTGLASSKSLTQSATAKMSAPGMEAEKQSFQQKQEKTIVSNVGNNRFEKNTTSSSSSQRFFSKTSSSSVSSSRSASALMSSNMKTSMSGSLTNLLVQSFDGSPLALPSPSDEFNTFLPIVSGKTSDGIRIDESDHKALEAECLKAEKKMQQLVDKLKKKDRQEMLTVTPELKDTLKKSWFMLGVEFSNRVCDKFRSSGGLDIIIENCKNAEDQELQRRSASVLQYSLNSANVEYVLRSSESYKIVELATSITGDNTSTTYIRSGIGIIANLFMSSEETCKELVKRGALDTIVAYCRNLDPETQRNCAYALANLALFGGSDCQLRMVSAKVPDWLLVLGFSMDDYVKYNACIAISILISNKEIEAAVVKSNSPTIIDQFIIHHTPSEFATIPHSKFYGQSKEWLKKFVPILDTFREEAKSMAAFHFAVSAFVKKRQGDASVFKEVNCINLLNKVASSPNASASRFAAQALKLIGAEVPHKLSQQVPLWSIDDVKEWVKQIGFDSFIQSFAQSKVDGDLLLQLTEDMLKDDIGIKNGILRKRFLRELGHLKRITDYSSCDPSNLADILEQIGPVYLQYAYWMLNSGVDQHTLDHIAEDNLLHECKIENSIHRQKIMNAITSMRSTSTAATAGQEGEKSLDVFVSYRRSNGSQLASLIKVLLQMRGFSTFIDIERLEAGKFDCNLINSIKQAKNFILVLTPNALDRCINDQDCKDWVHREIVEALRNNCNIIPVVENFEWPDPEALPEDMRGVTRFNGIRWIHEYQDACVDKLDRFIKGLLASGELEQHNKSSLVNGTSGRETPSGSMSPMYPSLPLSPASPSCKNRSLTSAN